MASCLPTHRENSKLERTEILCPTGFSPRRMCNHSSVLCGCTRSMTGNCGNCGQPGHYRTTCDQPPKSGTKRKTSRSVGSKKKPKKSASGAATAPVNTNPLVAVPRGLSPAQQQLWTDQVNAGVASSVSRDVREMMQQHVQLSTDAGFEDGCADLATLMPAPVPRRRHPAVGGALASIRKLLMRWRARRRDKPPAGTLNTMVHRAGFVKAPRTLDKDWGSNATTNSDASAAADTVHAYAGKLMDKALPLVGFSVTVVKTKGNIPNSYFESARKFLDSVVGPAGGRGAVGQEAGKKRGHIHLQMCCEIRTANAAAGAKLLKKVLLDNVLYHVEGRRCQVKPFGPFQDMKTMTGASARVGLSRVWPAGLGNGIRGVLQSDARLHQMRCCSFARAPERPPARKPALARMHARPRAPARARPPAPPPTDRPTERPTDRPTDRPLRPSFATVRANAHTVHTHARTRAQYCMKDDGLAHYRFHAVNMSPETLARCRDMYQVVRSSFLDGRKAISRRSIMRQVWQEWNHHIRPVARRVEKGERHAWGEWRCGRAMRTMLPRGQCGACCVLRSKREQRARARA